MAKVWEAPLDPTDESDYLAVFDETDDDEDPVLAEGEKIASFTAVPADAAAALGLTIPTLGDYVPSKVNDDTALLIWLSIDPDKRVNCEFGPGMAMDVETTIVTDSVPPRRFQRTFTVIVKHL